MYVYLKIHFLITRWIVRFRSLMHFDIQPYRNVYSTRLSTKRTYDNEVVHAAREQIENGFWIAMVPTYLRRHREWEKKKITKIRFPQTRGKYFALFEFGGRGSMRSCLILKPFSLFHIIPAVYKNEVDLNYD